MNDNDMITFMEIIRCGSISKAAERLFISQPALSLRVNSLEEKTGCKLFIRRKGNRNIELTPEGKSFIRYAERYIELDRDIRSLHTRASNPPFRVSALNSISTAILPRAFSELLIKCPDIVLKTEDLGSYSSYDSIEARRVDFALIVDRRYSMKALCRPLFSEHMTFICSANSDYPAQVSVKNLSAHLQVYSPWFLEYEQWNAAAFDDDSKPMLQVQIMHQMNYFLERASGWAIVPATVAHMLLKNAKISSRILTDSIPDRQVFYLVPSTEYYASPYVEPFMECLRNKLKRLEAQGLITCIEPMLDHAEV